MKTLLYKAEFKPFEPKKPPREWQQLEEETVERLKSEHPECNAVYVDFPRRCNKEYWNEEFSRPGLHAALSSLRPGDTLCPESFADLAMHEECMLKVCKKLLKEGILLWVAGNVYEQPTDDFYHDLQTFYFGRLARDYASALSPQEICHVKGDPRVTPPVVELSYFYGEVLKAKHRKLLPEILKRYKDYGILIPNPQGFTDYWNRDVVCRLLDELNSEDRCSSISRMTI